MKTDWEVKKLGEVCDFEGGAQPAKSNFIYEPKEGYVRFLQIRDFNSDKYITYIPESKKNRYCEYDDILIGRYGASVGKILINKKGAYNVAVMKTIPDAKHLDKRYLFLYLISDDFQSRLLKVASRSAQDGFSKDDIFNFPISLPPLPEQQRIVAILDEAFAAIDQAKANAQRNLQNAKELFDSYLQSVFANPGEGWEVCKVEDYIKFIDYRGRTPEKTLTGMRLITAKNVKLGYLQRAPEEFMNPEMYNSWMTRGIPKVGDVLFTTEAPLANVAQLDTDEKVAFAQRIIILQPQAKKLNSTFLKYLLLSSPIRKKILDQGTGATVQGIKASLLKKIEIYFPATITEQQSIIDNLEALSAETKKLEAIYQQKLIDLDELKKSILQKAFGGELSKTRGDARFHRAILDDRDQVHRAVPNAGDKAPSGQPSG